MSLFLSLCGTVKTDNQNRVILLSFTKTEGATYQLQNEMNSSLSTFGKILTTKQLIVRRGLAVVAAVAVLAVGVTIRFLTI